MTALTKSRDTVRAGDATLVEVLEVRLKAAAQVYSGGMVVVAAADGFGIPASNAAATHRIMGVAIKDVKGGAVDGDTACEVRRGPHWFTAKAGDEPLQVDVGKTVYIEDDQTIAKTAGALSAAGTLLLIGTAANGHAGEVLVQISGPAMP